MKTWFTTRTAWIDEQFVAAPSLTAGATSITVRAATGATFTATQRVKFQSLVQDFADQLTDARISPEKK